MGTFANKTIKPWAGNYTATPNGVIGQPGSYVASSETSETYTGDPDVIQAGAWASGFGAATLVPAPGGLASPVLQELNGALSAITQILGYVQQSGICEWKTDRIYRIGSLALGVNPASGVGNAVLYQSQVDNNSGNDPRTDSGANWLPYAQVIAGTVVPLGKQLHAWINFNGAVNPIVVNDSYGIASVTENAIGDYVFYFSTAFPNTNYGWTASETQVDNSSYLDQFTRLPSDIKTNGSIQLKILNGGTSALTSSPEVSCNFFGNT